MCSPPAITWRAARLPDGRRALHRAADPDRDQSYFLYATTPEQLDLLRFPLGELPKDKTRELAREFGLTVAEKADSQDICFVTQGRYSDVIERLKPGAVQGGEIVHLDGRVLGRHEGIIHYTVGQRKGLGLSVGEPLYVVRLDAKEARVVVGPREALATRLIRDHRRELARRRAAGEPWARRAWRWPCGSAPPASRVRPSCDPQEPALRSSCYRRKMGCLPVKLVSSMRAMLPGHACLAGAPSLALSPKPRPPRPEASTEGTFMTDGATTALMRKAYARWAPIYDLVYDKLTEPAARAAVNAAVACGPKVLEAGVGTGLSLGYYPRHAEVYGVDLSEDMLRRAQDKVDKTGPHPCEEPAGDGCHPPRLSGRDVRRGHGAVHHHPRAGARDGPRRVLPGC